MKIEGREIAAEILNNLTNRVNKLKKKGIIPTMAIILMGDNKESQTYVRQKELKAKGIGADTKLFHLEGKITNEEIEKLVKKLNKNPGVHGIILQRPAPENIKVDELTRLVPPSKEIDGFGDIPKYPVPVAQAVFVMLENIFNKEKVKGSFISWLKSKKIAIIGRGETAGKPIADYFKQLGLKPDIVGSKTPDKDKIIKKADILVTAVGKHILNPSMVKKGVILIGVGIYTNEEGKIKGDYSDEEMENVASYFSPTPGGVGPVNVACLLENLVKSAESFNLRS